jgi:nifR3 family TIM-barrel protein
MARSHADEKMLTFKKRLIQAPLAGYSCAPFRVLAQRYGQPDFCCSEMLSAQDMCHNPKPKKRYSHKSAEEGLLCVQLAGNKPEYLAEAAQKAMAWGADFIDLNCGCPQPKIRKKGLGSYLLADDEHLYRLVHAIKNAVSVPVFAKIRVDASSDDGFNRDVAQAIEAAGAAAITVHGRHWTYDYDIAVSYEDIAQIKACVTIPVIGNGDIYDTASAKKMLTATGCDAVMIARASVGQPWIFEQIYQELQGNVFIPPSLDDIKHIFFEHVAGLMQLENEKTAVLQSRKLLKYYFRQPIDISKVWLSQMNTVFSYDDLQHLVNSAICL